MAGLIRRHSLGVAEIFSFSGVAPGPFHLFFAAEGFSRTTIAGKLHAGETLNFPQTALAVATITTEVNVTATQSEIAAERACFTALSRLYPP